MLSMLHQWRNNPSVVLWSIGNEVPSQKSPDGYKVVHYLQDICHREDPTRICTSGINYTTAARSNGFADALDIPGLNYHTDGYFKMKAATHGNCIIGSETASTVSSRGVYSLDTSLKFHLIDDNQCSSYDVEAFDKMITSRIPTLKKILCHVDKDTSLAKHAERKDKEMWCGPKFLGNHSENMDYMFNKIYSCEIINGQIKAVGSLAGVSRMPYLTYETVVTIAKDGRIDFDVNANTREGCCWIQRFGYEFALAKENASFKYFGKGPGENYCDLQRYASYGMWESKAENEYFSYIMPQEHGNHTGVTYLELDNTLTFVADQPFECNVSLYSTDDLAKATHIDELHADGNTHVRIDYKNSGIGSHSCGPQLLDKYVLDGKNMNLKFSIKL
jgi:hypothetical protein